MKKTRENEAVLDNRRRSLASGLPAVSPGSAHCIPFPSKRRRRELMKGLPVHGGDARLGTSSSVRGCCPSRGDAEGQQGLEALLGATARLTGDTSGQFPCRSLAGGVSPQLGRSLIRSLVRVNAEGPRGLM